MALTLPEPAEPTPKGVRFEEETTVGNYFISNYPPYSFWTQDHSSEAHAALERPPAAWFGMSN